MVKAAGTSVPCGSHFWVPHFRFRPEVTSGEAAGIRGALVEEDFAAKQSKDRTSVSGLTNSLTRLESTTLRLGRLCYEHRPG